jgi:hypothetical protein
MNSATTSRPQKVYSNFPCANDFNIVAIRPVETPNLSHSFATVIARQHCYYLYMRAACTRMHSRPMRLLFYHPPPGDRRSRHSVSAGQDVLLAAARQMLRSGRRESPVGRRSATNRSPIMIRRSEETRQIGMAAYVQFL